MPINNLGIVNNPGKPVSLWRCAQPDKLGFELLQKEGFEVIYKLNKDSEFPVADEAAFSGLNVQYDPSVTSVKPDKTALITAAKQIINLQESGALVVVHCTHGRDRTGAVCATYRILTTKDEWEPIYQEFLAYDVTHLAPIFDMGIIEVLKDIYKENR